LNHLLQGLKEITTPKMQQKHYAETKGLMAALIWNKLLNASLC
jgi:hypothetical protein